MELGTTGGTVARRVNSPAATVDRRVTSSRRGCKFLTGQC